jgi:hypothetical protein
MKYLDHIKSKEPHERRRHALTIAGVLTGVFFVAWLATLPIRLASSAPTEQTTDSSLTASVDQTQINNQPGVEVSTSSVYSLPDDN